MSERPSLRAVDPDGLRAGARGWRVLVAAEHEDGIAGVCRDESSGELWLCGSLADGGASGIEDDEPTRVGLGDLTIAGGLVRPGADRVFVRDQTGAWAQAVVAGGAWLARAPANRELNVRAETAGGEILRPPLPAAARVRGPLADATDACNGCDTVAWNRVTWPGGIEWDPEHERATGEREVAVCRRCGNVVSADGVSVGSMSGADDLPEDHPSRDGEGEDPARPLTAAERASWAMLPFADARFPVYGLAEWAGERCWRGAGMSCVDGGPPEVCGVSLGHGSRDPAASRLIEVTTEFGPAWGSPREQLVEALEHEDWMPDTRPWPDSKLAVAIRFDRRRLLAGIAAELAVVEEIEVPVDGRPVPFLVACCGGGWVAYGVLDADDDRPDRSHLTVSVTATDQPFAPFALVEVQDVAPYVV